MTTAPTALATRRRRTWWPSTRAHRCTTAASAPASTACRWAWWSTARPSAFMTRARTSGPSATPSGGAWWRSSRGRLAIRSSTARPLAASCRRCFRASRPTACLSWRKSWAWMWIPSFARSTATTPPAASARSTTPRWTIATPKASRPPRRTGRGPSTRRPITATRSSRASPSLTWACTPTTPPPCASTTSPATTCLWRAK